MIRIKIPVIVVAVTVLSSFYGWAIVASTIWHPGSIGLNLDAPGGDYAVFYSGIRAFFSGHLNLIFDGDRFTVYLNSIFSWWFNKPIPFRPWVYPPTYLLMLLPFGALPFVASYLAFQLVSAGLLASALCFRSGASCPRTKLGWVALASPAASFNIVGGQNAFLVAALLIAGFRLVRVRPFVGGSLLGLLTFKPQFWILVPVALIAARKWKALVASMAAAAVLAAISAAVFGVDVWRQWLQFAIGSFAVSTEKWVEYGRMWGDSVYACVVAATGSQALANSAQAAAVLVAAFATYRAFRLPLAFDQKIAVVLAGTILAAPHSSLPDALLLALAAVLWISETIGEANASKWRWPLALSLWLTPLFNPPLILPAGRTTPFIIIAFILAVMAEERRRSAPREAVPA